MKNKYLKARKKRSVKERFIEKINKEGTFCEKLESNCWDFSCCHYKNGYARMKADGKERLAHRLSYELFIGEIPQGLDIDHLCRNRGCVNPSHLEPVTRKENVHRGISGPSMNAKKTHCLRGHVFEGNIRITSQGYRLCKICEKIRESKRIRPKKNPTLQ